MSVDPDKAKLTTETFAEFYRQFGSDSEYDKIIIEIFLEEIMKLNFFVENKKE